MGVVGGSNSVQIASLQGLVSSRQPHSSKILAIQQGQPRGVNPVGNPLQTSTGFNWESISRNVCKVLTKCWGRKVHLVASSHFFRSAPLIFQCLVFLFQIYITACNHLFHSNETFPINLTLSNYRKPGLFWTERGYFGRSCFSMARAVFSWISIQKKSREKLAGKFGLAVVNLDCFYVILTSKWLNPGWCIPAWCTPVGS